MLDITRQTLSMATSVGVRGLGLGGLRCLPPTHAWGHPPAGPAAAGYWTAGCAFALVCFHFLNTSRRRARAPRPRPNNAGAGVTGLLSCSWARARARPGRGVPAALHILTLEVHPLHYFELQLTSSFAMGVHFPAIILIRAHM